MEINIPCDEEGFVELQCHLCGEHFKLLVQDINDESNIDIWCPYCGLNEKNNMIFDSLKKMEKSIKKNKCVKPKEEIISPIKSKIDNLEIKHYKCCGTVAKINPLSIETGSYCPLCGGIDYE